MCRTASAIYTVVFFVKRPLAWDDSPIRMYKPDDYGGDMDVKNQEHMLL